MQSRLYNFKTYDHKMSDLSLLKTKIVQTYYNCTKVPSKERERITEMRACARFACVRAISLYMLSGGSGGEAPREEKTYHNLSDRKYKKNHRPTRKRAKGHIYMERFAASLPLLPFCNILKVTLYGSVFHSSDVFP